MTKKRPPSDESKHQQTRKGTAYHEAGHAIAAVRLDFDIGTTSISPADGKLGFSLSEHVWADGSNVDEAIVVLYAGLAAERLIEPNTQVQHGAQSFLNGGVFAGGRLPGDASIDEGAALYLLVRDSELLLVPQDADDEVSAVIDLRHVAKVLIDGEPYRPVFIPEAKDPPVREEHVDRSRSSKMELVFEDEMSVGFLYRGPFSRHLAESTAHAVDQARRPGAVKDSGGPLVSLHTIHNADTEPRAQATGPGHNGFE